MPLSLGIVAGFIEPTDGSVLAHGETVKGPGADRGVIFMCLQANIARQFEFVQSEWMNDSAFFGGSVAKDPVVGASDANGSFDIPRRPLRIRLQSLPRFVVTRGGEYCFLPGLRALRWLADLNT